MSAGLPGRLPQGEQILWQGSPNWRVLCRRVFHLKGLSIYFGVLLAYYVLHAYQAGDSLADMALTTAELAGLAVVPVALLALYAWGTARGTVYTITNRRVAIKMGIALPATINLPFARIDGAAYRPAKDGTGDIALQMGKGDRIGYLLLWPHARPWRMAKSEPMLRALPQAERVSQVLARALAASANTPVPAIPQLQDQGDAATIGATHLQAAAAA